MRNQTDSFAIYGPLAMWNSGRFAFGIGTIYCIGRNYASHAKELGNSVPSEPMVFMKSRNAVEKDGAEIAIPAYSSDCHYEGEIVLLVGGEAMKPRITGIGVGIDFTLRDIQSEVKKQGQPWTKAKNFVGSALLSTFYDLDTDSKGIEMNNLGIKTVLNGNIVQDGNSRDMIFGSNEIFTYIFKSYGLKPGDIIFTGTPEGVGKVQSGDSLEVQLFTDEEKICSAKCRVK